jgi:hypothetical protein
MARSIQSVVGSETNPILATRKIYNWTLENVDYWVKDPDHLKGYGTETRNQTRD